ncbi:MAG: N-acetylmuramoyl-L-alanine amidase [Elusimicrobia bacterium]|nr:N-acetylmuramoyl-L-alanine amidase [Elusimicrobiota bacterium]
MKRIFFSSLSAALLGISQAAAASEVHKPPVVTREQWGSKPHPIPASRKQTPVWITIHHAGELWTARVDPATFVRNMQVWGQNRPRIEKPPRDTYWPDLPYHFLIAPDGRIYEGRPVEYEPESNTNYPLNGNIGVEMMGDFNRQRPSSAQLRAAVQLTAWLAQTHRIPMDHIRTHRDAAPRETDCPGKDFTRYMKDGQFKAWVAATLKGETPDVNPGPALRGGPTAPIPGGKTAEVRDDAARPVTGEKAVFTQP